jgi:hypothetical protein
MNILWMLIMKENVKKIKTRKQTFSKNVCEDGFL